MKNVEKMAYAILMQENTNCHILAYLKREGINLTEWADRIGLDKATASKILHNKIGISPTRKIRIAKACNIDSRVFWPDGDEEE